jgi:hypothetical protein
MKSKNKCPQEPYMNVIVALFRIAKTWKQLKCPSTDEWINECGYCHPTKR